MKPNVVANNSFLEKRKKKLEKNPNHKSKCGVCHYWYKEEEFDNVRNNELENVITGHWYLRANCNLCFDMLGGLEIWLKHREVLLKSIDQYERRKLCLN